ncbi:MAG TPA: ABC transporter permease [Candidatus Limiplasma sp.]|nr:ABC transporter permease [Candidatus Limiplasma sp.]
MIIGDILSATLIFAVPLMLVALGGMFSERSGIVNIALEGIMIVGALAASLFLRYVDDMGYNPDYTQLYVLASILIAGIVGIIYSQLLAFASIKLKADQVISGTALNMLAPALAVVVTWNIQGTAQTTVLIPSWVRISQESLGIAGDNILIRFLFKSLFLTTPIAFILLLVSIFFLYHTKTGLRLRACGEHPQAADSVGVNVYRMRYLGVGISGFFAGIGGIAYTLAAGSGFTSTVAGYGFLALAVMIFGNWKPVNILFASFFFAFFRIISFYSNSLTFLPTFDNLASSEYIYLIMPYLVTMIILVLTSKRSRAPKAEGIPYDKGRR